MTADVNKSEVAAAYDQWADTYDNDHNRTRDLAGNILREAGLAVAGRSVVEIGCGTGRNTEWLAVPMRKLLMLSRSISQRRCWTVRECA
jgi:malonyl-CoA O-methyltransferase